MLPKNKTISSLGNLGAGKSITSNSTTLDVDVRTGETLNLYYKGTYIIIPLETHLTDEILYTTDIFGTKGPGTANT